MTITPVRHPIALGVLAIYCLAFGSVVRGSATGTTKSLTLFDCNARYVQLNAVSGAVLNSGVYGGFKQSQPKVDGCLIADIQDPNKEALYALVPSTPRIDTNGEQGYSVASLDRKTLSVLHKYDLPNKQSTRPILMFDPSRHNLLLAMDNYESWQRLEIKVDGSLSPVGQAFSVQTQFPTSPTPYIDDQGNIVDGLQVLDPHGRLIQQVQADSILTPELQEDFRSLTLIDGSAKHYYGTIPAASAADRIVFTVGWDTEATRVPSAGVIVYDLNSKRAISSFHTPFPVAPGYSGEVGVPSIHISPNGQTIVIEQYEWRQNTSDPSRQVRYRTGKLAVYDANTGSLIGTVFMNPQHTEVADGRLIDFSSDSHSLHYEFDHHVLEIDLGSASITATIPLPERFNPAFIVSGR